MPVPPLPRRRTRDILLEILLWAGLVALVVHLIYSTAPALGPLDIQ